RVSRTPASSFRLVGLRLSFSSVLTMKMLQTPYLLQVSRKKPVMPGPRPICQLAGQIRCFAVNREMFRAICESSGRFENSTFDWTISSRVSEFTGRLWNLGLVLRFLASKRKLHVPFWDLTAETKI